MTCDQVYIGKNILRARLYDYGKFIFDLDSIHIRAYIRTIKDTVHISDK